MERKQTSVKKASSKISSCQ